MVDHSPRWVKHQRGVAGYLARGQEAGKLGGQKAFKVLRPIYLEMDKQSNLPFILQFSAMI